MFVIDFYLCNFVYVLQNVSILISQKVFVFNKLHTHRHTYTHKGVMYPLNTMLLECVISLSINITKNLPYIKKYYKRTVRVRFDEQKQILQEGRNDKTNSKSEKDSCLFDYSSLLSSV